MFVTKDFTPCRHQPLVFLLMYFIWRKNKMLIHSTLFQGMLNNVNIWMQLTPGLLFAYVAVKWNSVFIIVKDN